MVEASITTCGVTAGVRIVFAIVCFILCGKGLGQTGLSFYSDKKSLASKNPVNSFDSWSQNMPNISKST